jgi:hypothetical protein
MRFGSTAAGLALVLVASCGGGSSSTPSGGGGTDGGGPTDGGTPDACTKSSPPVVEPSVQLVNIVVRNSTPTDRWVVAAAQCGAFGLTGPHGPVVLSLPPQCGCECPPAPAPEIALVRIPAGNARAIAWDATELVPHDVCLTCGGARVVHTTSADRKVAPAGAYAITIRSFATPPCPASGDEVKCPGACPANADTKGSTFDLPASGGTEVTVDL